MIKTGFNSAPMNESFSGELAQAVKHLTPIVKKRMVQGLGDVDIENTNIPITKLSGPRDPKIKSREYYFFLVYKAASGSTPYALAVTDEVHQKMVIDVRLNTVINAAGDIIAVNSNAGNLNWTKRISYAYAIYAIKASDAASAAAKRAARKDAKAGSDLDPSSPNYRRKGVPVGWLGQNYDKSGYLGPSAGDWVEKKIQSKGGGKLDLDGDIQKLQKLFDEVIDNFAKMLQSYKGHADKWDRFKEPSNDYRNVMVSIVDEINRLNRIKDAIAKAGSVEKFLQDQKFTGSPADWIATHSYRVSENLGRYRNEFNRIK